MYQGKRMPEGFILNEALKEKEKKNWQNSKMTKSLKGKRKRMVI